MLFLAATEKFERGLGGGETEVAGEEGVVDESELFGYFLDGIEAGEKEACLLYTSPSPRD